MSNMEKFTKWRQEEERDIESCKQRLAKRHKLKRNRKFEKAWQIAWDLGHSSGFHEIESYFDDLAELLKP